MSGLVVAVVDPNEARRVARDILGGRQYHSSPTPRPFRKPLSWLGDRVHGVIDGIEKVLSYIPTAIGLVVAVVAIVLAIVYVVRRVQVRRGGTETRFGAQAIAGRAAEDPAVLEREADEAERAGRLDDALRLRFRAGLLRLGARGAIRYRPSVTTNEVRRVLGSDAFDELARTFEDVAYGGHGAQPPDVDSARRMWPAVVASAARRNPDDT